MFAGFMMNAWTTATIVAVVAGVVGLLRRAARLGVPRPRHPQGRVRRRGRRQPARHQHPRRPGRVLRSSARSGSARSAAAAVTTSSTALALVMMLALGAAFLSRTTEYEPEIYSLLFGEVLGVSTSQILPVAALGHRLHRRDRGHLPAAHALLHRPRDRRGQGHPQPPHRDLLPARRRPRDRHDRARRRRPADLQPDDRPPGRRPVPDQPAAAGHGSVGRHRPGHRLGRDRRCPTCTTGRSASSSAHSARCPTASAAAGPPGAAPGRSAFPPPPAADQP